MKFGLTQEEWALILDANNGHLPSGFSAKGELLPNIVDHITLNNADVVHGCDGDALKAKLAALPDADWAAMLVIVTDFWEDPENYQLPEA